MGRRVEVPAGQFRGRYLEVTEEAAEMLGDGLEMEPLCFRDIEGRRYVFEWFPDRRLLGRLGEWYRTNGVSANDTIVIEEVDPSNREFQILVEGQTMSAEESTGLYLGRAFSTVGTRKMELARRYYMPLADLVTHCFICGVTGSGKTVLAKVLVEEAAFHGIPSILIDLKGDLSSLAITLKELTPKEFHPWMSSDTEEERRRAAEAESSRHGEKLQEFGLTPEQAAEFARRVDPRIYTPRSSKGRPMAIASFLDPPDDIGEVTQEERENLLRSLTDAFVERLYYGARRGKIENERTYLYDLIDYAWREGISLKGLKGLEQLLRLVGKPPFDHIGSLPVEQYIDADNRRKRLLNKINTLLTGPEKAWFEGSPVEMKDFLSSSQGRVPINIINLRELDRFEDRVLVIYHITSKIQNWMRKQAGSNTPRLLFLIDEIGGGGGKEALFPSYPYDSAAKWGLNYLLRQGRAFGVCSVFATQNPGDVDYKGLSNCGTWMVGKLATKRDQDKVMEGMAVMGVEAARVKQNLTSAGVGEFVIRDPRGEVHFIRQRWLYTYHRVLTIQEVERICRSA